MNSPFVLDCSKRIATKLLADEQLDNDRSRVQHAYRLLFSRPPRTGEETLAIAFLQAYPETLDELRDPQQRRLAAWTALCQTLVVSNDFVYVT